MEPKSFSANIRHIYGHLNHTTTTALQHKPLSRACLVNRKTTRAPVNFLIKEKKMVNQLQGSPAAMKTKNYLWREAQGDK